MSVLVAARTLGKISAWRLTNLETQKHLYVAHMLHLGRAGAPLFSEPFEAWEYGPVVPLLYRRLKKHGREPVAAFEGAVFAGDTPEYMAVADAAVMVKHMSPSQLIAYTHRVGGAWERHYKVGNGVIPNSAILDEFNRSMRPSDDAVAWAEEMADQVAAYPSKYLDSEDERAFRARVLSANFH